MFFNYKGIDTSGKKVNGFIEAISIEQAKLKLYNSGILFIFVKEKKTTFLIQEFFKFTPKMNVLYLSYISRDLSLYLNSGISLVKSISLLSENYSHNKQMKLFFESLKNSLDEGKNLSVALEAQKVFKLPTFYLQSIKVSENSGLLQSVLHELAVFLKNQDKIKKQMTSSMAYPLFILVVAFLMVGFMLSVIVPKITSIFTQFDKKLPVITNFVIKLGEFFSMYYLELLITSIILIILFIVLLNKVAWFRYKLDFLLLRLPFFNKLILYSELSRFSYMNSILIKSGVPIVQSIKLSADILKNLVIKKVFIDASLKVVEGESLSKILNASSIYKIDHSFIQAIAIGEETSQLGKILDNLAKMYLESNKDKLSIVLALLEPFMMLIVGLIIGFIVLAMMLPIFTMNLG